MPIVSILAAWAAASAMQASRARAENGRLRKHGRASRSTIALPSGGQAFDWDPVRPRMMWTIDCDTRNVIASAIPRSNSADFLAAPRPAR